MKPKWPHFPIALAHIARRPTDRPALPFNVSDGDGAQQKAAIIPWSFSGLVAHYNKGLVG